MIKSFNRIPAYLIGLGSIFLLYQSIASPKPFLTIILANVVIILGLIPFYLYVRKNNFNYLPILELQGVFYALTFGYVALQEFTRTKTISDKEINITLGYVILGLLSMYFSFYKLAPGFIDKKVKPLSLEKIRLSVVDLKNFAMAYSVLFVMYNLFVPVKLESINTLVELLSLFSKGILFYLLLQNRLSFNEKIFVIILILFDIITGLTAGVLASFSSLLVFIAIIYIHLKKKIPYVLGLIVIVFFIAMQTIKIQYRDIVWFGGGKNFTTMEKVGILYNLISDYYSKPTQAFNQAKDAAYYRIDHLGTTAIVISSTPNPVAYKYGLTYYPIFTKFIPRIIWKDKPEEITGNIWAKWYGLLNPYDYNTSFNLPWFTELYINFGPPGIIFGMMFFGLLLRFLIRLFSASSNELVFLIGLVLTYHFYGPESHFSLKVGNLFLGAIALYIFLRFLNNLKFRK